MTKWRRLHAASALALVSTAMPLTRSSVASLKPPTQLAPPRRPSLPSAKACALFQRTPRAQQIDNTYRTARLYSAPLPSSGSALPSCSRRNLRLSKKYSFGCSTGDTDCTSLLWAYASVRVHATLGSSFARCNTSDICSSFRLSDESIPRSCCSSKLTYGHPWKSFCSALADIILLHEYGV